MDDRQLVDRCLTGDAAAWEEVVHTHSRRIYNLCLRFTGRPEDAEDLAQEVFIRLYRNLAGYRADVGSLATWLTTLTRNLLIDHYRRGSAARRTDPIETLTPAGELAPLPLAAPGRSATDAVWGREVLEHVQAALSQISPELRETIILRDLQDLDYKEIAVVLHLPEGTVKSRLNRGRIELARLLRQSLGADVPPWPAQIQIFGCVMNHDPQSNAPSKAWTCADFEAALSDYREGTLAPAAAAAARHHLSACDPCADLVLAVNTALAGLAALPQLAPPRRLAQAIFAQTLAPSQPRRGPLPSWHRFWGALTSPRFALGLAMSVFTFSLLLNAAQVNLRQVSLRQLAPTRLGSLLQRNLNRTWARGVSYYHDLRVVYEIEAAVHQMRQPASPPALAPDHHHSQRNFLPSSRDLA